MITTTTFLTAIILVLFLVGMSVVLEMQEQKKLIDNLRQGIRHQKNIIEIQRKQIETTERENAYGLEEQKARRVHEPREDDKDNDSTVNIVGVLSGDTDAKVHRRTTDSDV